MAVPISRPVLSGPRPIDKAIVFAGHSGCGKSYICNRIFKHFGNPRRFKSEDSNFCVTNKLQHDIVNINGQSVTIVDSPGFLDNGNPGRVSDGRNTCKLVKVLESVQELYALVFVYHGPFTKAHKKWFDRMNKIVSASNQGHIVLLRNKAADPGCFSQMREEMRKILERDKGYSMLQYMMLEYNPEQGVIQKMMDQILRFDLIKLDKLTVPSVCYKHYEESEPYEEELSRITNSSRQIVAGSRQEIQIVQEERRRYFGLFKIWVDVPKVFDLKSEYTVTWEQTTTVVATFINIYKIRFDGSKDLAEKKKVGSREETHDADVFLI